MASEDQILLKLVIQGQSPDEIRRLAQATQGQLNSETKVLLDQLTALHRGVLEAQNADIAKQIKNDIKARQDQLATVSSIMSAQTAAAVKEAKAQAKAAEERADAESKAYQKNIKDAEAAFEYTLRLAKMKEAEDAKAAESAKQVADAQRALASQNLEDFKNAIVIARNVAAAFQFVASQAVQLGNDIDRLTNVYGSLKGSIDEMREASAGEISDYDLITTKNRALEKDLKLTDEQFGIVARAADNFADSIGVNTKEALDQLIDGLATGRLRTLASAGAVMDSEVVYERYAKSIGVASDKLSEHGKKVAVIQEALRLLDKKNKESGEVIDDFSHRWEKFTAQIQNFSDTFKLTLGSAIMSVWNMLDSVSEKLVEVFSTANSFSETGIGADQLTDLPGKHYTSADLKKMQGRYHSGPMVPEDFLQSDKYKYSDAGDAAESKKALTSEQIAAAARKKAELAAQFDAMMRKAYAQSGEGYGFDPSAGQTPNLDELGFTASTAMGNEEGQRLEQGTLDTLLNQATGGGTKGQSFQEQVEAFEKDFIEPLKQKTQAYQAELDATKEKAGGGLFAVLLFGPDGPDSTYAEMDSFQQATTDMSGAVADTIHKMAEATAADLANYVAGSQGAKKSMRDTTNELLIALSTKGYMKSLEYIAEAAGDYATENYVGAEKSLAAAAAWAALGTAAGLGARAIGHSAPAGSSTSSSRGGGIASRGSSSGVSSTSSSSGDNTPLTINLTVLPGGEAEAGRAINKALDAYYAQTGKGVKAA
jgi:hypothetical protein